MQTEELKKQIRSFDLAVLAGKKRQSPRTGLIHLFPNDEALDTIPLYENFSFALALFRQKTAESVTEGKALIERLLAFQVEDNFPVYLHEFPKCFDHNMGLKIGPIFAYLLRLFGPILGELKPKVEKALRQILAKRPEKPFWENRYRALVGEFLLPQETANFSALDWTEWLITWQLAGETHITLPYDPELQLLLPKLELQEKGEPKPNPIEWLLAEPNYSTRLLRDHPHQLLIAPLFPIAFTTEEAEVSTVRLFWKGTKIHSLTAKKLVVDLDASMELGRNDLFEAAVYCDISPETQVFVEGKRATTFQFGDLVTIVTPEKTIEVRFELTLGSGDFFGHIFRANRPSQVANKGALQHEAYDWQIGMRTLRRSTPAQIRITIS